MVRVNYGRTNNTTIVQHLLRSTSAAKRLKMAASRLTVYTRPADQPVNKLRLGDFVHATIGHAGQKMVFVGIVRDLLLDGTTRVHQQEATSTDSSLKVLVQMCRPVKLPDHEPSSVLDTTFSMTLPGAPALWLVCWPRSLNGRVV